MLCAATPRGLEFELEGVIGERMRRVVRRRDLRVRVGVVGGDMVVVVGMFCVAVLAGGVGLPVGWTSVMV